MEMVAHSQGDSRSGSEFEIAIERLDPTPDWEELPNIFAHTHTQKRFNKCILLLVSVTQSFISFVNTPLHPYDLTSLY